MEEIASLFIENNNKSYFYTDNFAKKDSLMSLVSSGKVSAFEVMGNNANLFRTKFDQHIVKTLSNFKIKIVENIFTSSYAFTFQPNFSWQTQPDTSTINGFHCNKAIGSFGGRNYEAWFTKDIPIQDGPYVFAGLPGLIVNIQDLKNHYEFSLISFEECGESTFIETPNLDKKAVEATRIQVFEARERLRTQFHSILKSEMGFSINETPEMERKRKNNERMNNNPLELKVD